MEFLEWFMPTVWFVILALFLLLYVILDGFDLGVGILSLTSPSESQRTILMTSLGNVWDANETWLVLMGGALFGAFPLAYGTILKALYGPIYLMILGLILRAVAFEFRENATNKRPWNLMFGIGSVLAAGSQGICLGTVLSGIPTDAAGHFTGSVRIWVNPSSLVVALTLIQGYVLIGSTYLILKTSGELQRLHVRTARLAAATTLGGALLITLTAPFASEALRQRLFDPAFLPFFVVLPLLGVALIVQLFRSLAMQQEVWPFVYTVLLFILSFAGLGVMVFPAVIPPSVTIFQASSSVSSMVFMLTFIGVLIPIMLFYNIYNYIAFRGKVGAE
ncbi:cytochrome d ubiquinol oxidase subunit II [Synechococcus lacustris]|uniref:cytochrome d ubiquinol oxidase subunit II n=1 Tax=Synechococcus lacustris TaxID=2116544 RepID=UPI0020CC3016|nr:cytochrome d ubiquinol oxidase subunit II [Synechococcus lacustris]MCP9795435.1 cytochrome d ubiquinol oxidase subunit II [Synechococcus lacustris L1F-Slac]MCP9813919.1 cytochrome d ubiquinol oxidase subunit II [Synechococcus lacustris L1E-Slac]MCP9925949.1 cytochrome d ubiquinol oxidase subunit II [Synechococcus lacustris C3-12m-Tous]